MATIPCGGDHSGDENQPQPKDDNDDKHVVPENSSSFRTSFEALKRSLVRQEVRALELEMEFMNGLWQSEVSMYEADEANQTNQPNAEGVVVDNQLFPYHDALYPLLDVYYYWKQNDGDDDEAEGEEEEDWQDDNEAYQSRLERLLGRKKNTDDEERIILPSPVPPGQGRRRALPTETGEALVETAVEDYLPNSPNAIWTALLPRHRARAHWKRVLTAPGLGGWNRRTRDGWSALQQQERRREAATEAQERTEVEQMIARDWNVGTGFADFLDMWDEELQEDHEDYVLEFHKRQEAQAAAEGDGEGGDKTKSQVERKKEDSKTTGPEEEKEALPVQKKEQLGSSKKNDDDDKEWLHEFQRLYPFEGHAWGAEHLSKDDDKEAATLVLLKVLRHALSDLQRDYRLARAVLLCLAEYKLMTVQTLRRLFCILSSEYVHWCDGQCHARFLRQQAVRGGGARRGGATAAAAATAAADEDDEEEEDEDETEEEEFEDVEDDEEEGNDDEDDGGNDDYDDSPTPPNHFCPDWKDFLGSVKTVLSRGIQYMTAEHATALSAMVLMEYDGASTAAAELDETYFNAASSGAETAAAAPETGAATSRAKSLLKQNLFYYHRLGEDDDESDEEEDLLLPPRRGSHEPFHWELVLFIVAGLGRHAFYDRNRLRALGASQGDEARRVLDSYWNCVRALVDIGESTVRRLPPNKRTEFIGSFLVRYLTLAHVNVANVTVLPRHGYLGNYLENPQGKLMISAHRYADAITKATARQSLGKDKPVWMHWPHEDVCDIVRALFLRELVEPAAAGCGYGDFRVWCGLPMTPLDPLLFLHGFNFPNVLEDQLDGRWGMDETTKSEICNMHLSARYDFTLLLLVRAWRAPWTLQSQASFSLAFMEATRTLALCFCRYNIPVDVVRVVTQFLPRSWWHDERRQCWYPECQVKELWDKLRWKVMRRENVTDDKATLPLPDDGLWDRKYLWSRGIRTYKRAPQTSWHFHNNKVRTCQGCQLACYCSKDHLKYLMQEGHRRVCGYPPYRVLGGEEEKLCRLVLGDDGAEQNGKENQEEEDNDEDDDDDEDEEDEEDWESVDTMEGEEGEGAEQRPKNMTDHIFEFFDSKAYRHHKREQPAFANFF